MSRYAQRTLIQQGSVANWGKAAGGSTPTAISKTLFTSSGSFVCPAGVSFVNILMSGGGGGTGFGSAGGTGGTSSFSGGVITTFSCVGGAGTRQYFGGDGAGFAGLTSSGLGSQIGGQSSYSAITQSAQDGLVLQQGIDVVAGVTYTVSVGAGGTAGSSGYAGGAGFVDVMYQVGTPTIKSKTFLASGTYTVPATAYAVRATVVGGGGGASDIEGGLTVGGTSSAAFASGTISGLGGKTLGPYNRGPNWNGQAYSGLANSGKAGRTMWTGSGGGNQFNLLGGNGQENKQWVSVTPAESVVITVGSAGGGNHCSGGSGYVMIEWSE